MNEIIIAPSITDWVTAISASSSVVILLFYTIYTYRMQKAVEKQSIELVHQRRLGIMPLLILDLENTVEDNYILKNVGNGTAVNVKIISTNVKENDVDDKPEISFEEILMIRPDETTRVRAKGMLIPDIRVLRHMGILRFGKICFQDIEGNIYEEDLRNCIEQKIKFSFPKLTEKK